MVNKEFGFYSECKGKLMRAFHRRMAESMLQFSTVMLCEEWTIRSKVMTQIPIKRLCGSSSTR